MTLNNRLVMAVDDGPGPRIIFKDSGVVDLGFSLHSEITCSTEDTLRVISEHNPGVILMDHDLGNNKYSGLTIWKAIRKSGYPGIILPNSGASWEVFAKEQKESGDSFSDPDMCERLDVFKQSSLLKKVIEQLISEGRL